MIQFRLALGAVGALLIASSASAENVTPSHVYQTVESLNLQLNSLLQADFETPVSGNFEADLAPRRPRHVIQKAREVLIKLQQLRRINGLPMNEVAPLPLREITPGDVIGVTRQLVTEVAELRPVYGISGEPAAAALPEGKTPTNVYGNLIRSAALLDQLGIPKSVPNDVYRAALTIISDLEKVRQAKGVEIPVEEKSGSTGKPPAEVYAKGYELLEMLKQLSEKQPEYAVPGGIVLPKRKTGTITPTDVVDLMNNVLADLAALKNSAGATSPTQLAPPQSGKTPSHSYDALQTAIDLASTLFSS